MCTVTYLPKADGGFIFTSNRDEQAARSPEKLRQIVTSQGLSLTLPQDTAGGSWIVLSEDGRLACLLNGAFVRHQRKLPYRRSRGLVVLDFFSFNNGQEFWDQYDFNQIEPFTLITIEAGYQIEGRWDGQQIHLRHFPADEPQIWASATLYTTEMQLERQEWWAAFLSTAIGHEPAEVPIQKTAKAVENFHLTAGKGDPATNLRMSRPAYGVETVSVSQIVAEASTLSFRYHELIKEVIDERKWAIPHLSSN